MVDLTFHSQAEAEYEDALDWYYHRSPQAADRFEAAVNRAIMAIEAHPTMFPLCDDIHHFVLVRQFPYTIIYRVNENAIRIIAVAHAKRLPGYWSNRE